MNVSVYVPCYNGEAWLAECLEALLAQSFPAAEILVVDDGSTDRSPAIARGFGERVRLVPHGRNRGLAVARNTALHEARGEVVASVDADVRAAPDWLRRLLDAFDSPRTAAVGGRLVEAHQQRLADRWRAAHMAQHAGDFPLANPPVLAGANVAVRRRVVEALGGYDESFRTNYEDADLQHRLIAAGYRVRYEPAAQAMHLRTDTVQSLLRTYWNWLRPPSERAGAFHSLEGLERKGRAAGDALEAALWDDVADGRPELAYITVLALLALPLADLHHAAELASQRADEAAASRFRRGLLDAKQAIRAAVGERAPALAVDVAEDVDRFAWWSAPPPGAGATSTGRDPGLPWAAEAVARVPLAWWPVVAASRRLLAQEAGWPVSAAGDGDVALDGRWRRLAAELSRRSRRLLAVIAHGALVRGEQVPGAPLELLLVTTVPLGPGQQDELAAAARAAAGATPVEVQAIEAHRIGWLRPSVHQLSLVAGGVVAWGEPAALRAVPPWRPEQLDPRQALDELAAAERALGDGRAELGALRAAGALLIARRAYSPRLDARRERLRRQWPEAPPLGDTEPEVFVHTARRLLESWLLQWERGAPTGALAARLNTLRAAARPFEGASW